MHIIAAYFGFSKEKISSFQKFKSMQNFRVELYPIMIKRFTANERNIVA